MKLANILFVVSTLYSQHIIAADLELNDARISLKNYGLTKCISAQFNQQSEIKKDLNHASRSYHFMGKGKHIILQNEDTLETLHDPYKAVVHFMKESLKFVKNTNKLTNTNIATFNCLSIYNSDQYDTFIRSQDSYIK